MLTSLIDWSMLPVWIWDAIKYAVKTLVPITVKSFLLTIDPLKIFIVLIVSLLAFKNKEKIKEGVEVLFTLKDLLFRK